MEGEKDTSQKGHNDIKDKTSSLMLGSFNYRIVLLKVEKISAAVYLLTNHISSDESVRRELRDLGLALIKDIHWLPYEPSTVDKNSMMHSFVASARSLLSHLRIARAAGLISEQNESVLKREIEIILPSFDGSVFVAEDIIFPEGATEEPMRELPKAFHHAEHHERHKGHSFTKRTNISERHGALKSDRRDKIMAFLRGKGSVGIKDICDQFTDVSEKTIQRELTKLVSEKAIDRQGNKRWSRYSVA